MAVTGSRRTGSVRGQGRRLLLDAARDLFSSKAYLEVSTKEIADRAGVTEPMLFRHFGSKNALFEEAVFEPFNEFLSDFIADWEDRPRGTREPLDECRDLYRGLYQVLAENRQLVRALIAAEALQGGGDGGSGVPPLGRILRRFEKLTIWERQVHHFRSYDPTILTHVIFGMVFSVAIHGDWMRAGITGPTPDVDAYLDEMATLTVYGLFEKR